MIKTFASRIALVSVMSFICLSVLFSQEHKSVLQVNGMAVGAEVASFSATDQHGNNYVLSEALKKGPVVLLFYRGQWCPVCTRHLSHLQDSLQMIYDKGASVIAISPERPEYLEKTASHTRASFTLLYDKDYSIGEAFDVVFTPEKELIAMYDSRLNADLEHAHSDSSARLPVPATFIINADSKIVWRQFNPDYRVRGSVKEILENIPSK